MNIIKRLKQKITDIFKREKSEKRPTRLYSRADYIREHVRRHGDHPDYYKNGKPKLHHRISKPSCRPLDRSFKY